MEAAERHPVTEIAGRRGRAGGRRGTEARVAAAEGLGTMLLVLLTCLPTCGVAPPPPPHPALVALGGGLAVAALVQCFDHVSGAMFNPTVTLAALLWGRVSARRAALATLAQAAGALLGAALLQPLGGGARCVTAPAAAVGALRAAGVEAALGGVLALANCASWDARNRRLLDSWPLRVGLIVAALSMQASHLTGASMNPFRSFAPALFAGQFEHQWVYWVGPLSGSLVCTWLYTRVWRPHGAVAARGSSPPPAEPHKPPED